MGRSVDYLSRAIYVAYFDVEAKEYEDEEGNIQQPDEFDYECTWDDFIGNITYSLLAKYKSLSKADDWDGRETKIFLDNSLVEIGVSEYCGLASVSIRAKEDKEGLAENWIRKNWANMLKVMRDNTYHECYTKVGTFSNGEGVYTKVA